MRVAPSQPHKTLLLQALAPLYPVTQTHHSWVLQGWAAFTSSNRQVGQSSPYPLHPPAQQPQGSRNDANPKLQARQETLLPLSSCTASSFLHPSPEQDMFYSSPSKDSINSFNSFRNWIASGWGGGPGARKDVIQQDLLSDKDSAQNRYLMTVYLQITWSRVANLKRYLPFI